MNNYNVNDMKRIRKMTEWVFVICYMPFYLLGYLLYLLGRGLKIAGHLLMINPHSVKQEAEKFFSVFKSPSDL